MLTPVFDVVFDIIVPMLDPLDLCKLRGVNRHMAKSIDYENRRVDEAMSKFERLIVVSDDTVRIHSRSGKKMIELILQEGVGETTLLRMQYEGRPYHGWADPWMCIIDGKRDNLIRYVFHNKSTRLLNAEAVFIEGFQELRFRQLILIDLLIVSKNETDSRTFSLNFVPKGWSYAPATA